MSDEKKAFFRERDAREIRKLHVKQVFRPRKLVKRILDLDSSEEALELKCQITPGRFFRNVETGAEASRKCFKHGDLIILSQPQSQQEAYRCRELPYAIRQRDFSQLQGMKEEEINFVGYSFRPVQGRDSRIRIVPLCFLPEAVKLFGYAEYFSKFTETDEKGNRIEKFGIQVVPYSNARRVEVEGADIVCKVPSRREKRQKYTLTLKHVPVEGVTERRAVAWSLASKFGAVQEPEEIEPEIREPEHSTYNIRYTWRDQRKASDVFTFYPHDIAAYIATIKHFRNQHNSTPIEMSPLALVSRQEAEFYNKLCNNVLIYDSSLSGKEKTRKLHLDEKCILTARSIGVLGPNETMFWLSERDGLLKDYDWSVR